MKRESRTARASKQSHPPHQEDQDDEEESNDEEVEGEVKNLSRFHYFITRTSLIR